ncbi:MAG: 23S rRNA (pseudouridine(1915)-N(3))-methyltransferase RlmH [Oscillospiraceae bacterium]|nr:23S rRNA (pseudouridine(1915)-N(3))-methyltransferase RlmH [Oscillospiraceae bacterium]
MQTIELICIGKLGAGFYGEGCAEYIKRLKPFYNLKISELPETRLLEDNTAGRLKVIESESRLIASRLKGAARTAALCVEGKSLTSEELARFIKEAALDSRPLAFIIGGSLGLTEELKQSCGLRLSLSAMTLPHKLARLVLLEQIYRAATINNNIKYHK